MINLRDIYKEKLSNNQHNQEASNMMWNRRAKEVAGLAKVTGDGGYWQFFIERANLKGTRVLDAGCGAGRYLKKIMDAGALGEGLEPAELMADEAVNYLRGAGYEPPIHRVAFEDFDPPHKYDYVFISNSPISSRYENYEKLISIAEKGLFIGSWLKRRDSLCEEIAHELGKDFVFTRHETLTSLLNLFISDGYYPDYSAVIDKGTHTVEPEKVAKRYTSWIFGADYSDDNEQIVLQQLLARKKRDGQLTSTYAGAQGMLYVNLQLNF
ncbi:MAG: class I SAM-dependent methyltransferase [Fastidiosipilaceae bacterium]|jgi:SAM-dependent methyltransferase|nr:class I SAM-dependent methyltransferase [Clostridiaceae bacterium]